MPGTCLHPITRHAFIKSVGAGALLAGAVAGERSSSAFAQPHAGPNARLSQASGTPTPQWNSIYRSTLGTTAMGYAYAAAQNGSPIAGAGVNLSRSPNEAVNPGQTWTLDTLFNLGSLSKSLTAVGFMTLVQQQGTQLLDMPACNVLSSSGLFSGPLADGVATITIRQLLSHYSGFGADTTIEINSKTVDQYVNDLLQKPLANKPGSTYLYSNANFDVLGVLYEILAGAAPGSYVQLVKDNVLTPMGIDTNHAVTDTPDPGNEAVSYSGPNDTRMGRVWPLVPLIASGGWLGTVNGMLKFLLGIRSNAVLDSPTTQLMFTQQFGWAARNSPFGPYYRKDGILLSAARPAQEVHTGMVVFPDGYDAVLFVNSETDDPIEVMVKAFQAQSPSS